MLAAVACEPGNADDARLMVESDSPATQGSVLAEAISIETSKGQLAPILAADCPLPCSETVTFESAEEGQGEILIYVFRGNSESTDAAVSLGTFEIAGLPPTSGDAVEVQVSFRADRAGVSLAIEAGSGAGATLRRVDD
jgi:molecular chaperone DnaK (HSP70)